ncbi:MAG: hypothetical protein ABGZ53_30690 [Fuerstiella sp.]
MSETTANKNPYESSHDGNFEPAAHGGRCPGPVKMVAAGILLMAAVNLSYSFFFFAVSKHLIASLAFCKGLLGIAAALGLLNLKDGWRFFVLVTTGLGVLILPFYFLAIVLSSDLSRFVSDLSGIDSRGGIAVAIALFFAMFLWICRTLVRPDIEKAFHAERQQRSVT